MKNLAIFSLLVVVATACEKTIPLDLKQIESKVVIEGQVTNNEGRQFVKVSRSNSFYSTGASPRITNATVVVTDDAGNTFNYVHNPNQHADSAGYYLPETAFTGVVGRTYSLSVLVDGQSYTATDKMFRTEPIDKLEYEIDEDEQEDPEIEGRFYQILMFVKEPQETKDYYMFKSYRNDSLTYQNETDVYYADDEFVGENIDGIGMPVYYSRGDKARIELYAISREAFVFYRDLDKLLNNDGGMFGTPPADPRTNLSNGALGLFQACSVVSAEIEIE